MKNVRFASTLPNDSDTRVFIYEDCEEMTEEQQNVLLKAIEEPSKYNRYIFTCSNASAILETIKSRLVCIPISDMTAEECVSCLEYNGYDSDTAKRSHKPHSKARKRWAKKSGKQNKEPAKRCVL